MKQSQQMIVSLVGLPGAGKSALQRAMQEGQAALVEVPLLREVMDRGFACFDLEQSQRFVSGAASAAEVLAEALGDEVCLVNDNVLSVNEISAAGDYRQQLVVVVARPWLAEARCRLRYQRRPDPAEEALAASCTLSASMLLEHVQSYGLPVTYVDGSDYPMREVTLERAQEIVADEQTVPPRMPEHHLLYQQALVVQGIVIYKADDEGPRWEQIRRDAILPVEMDLRGKTVLDVGAAEGNFCWEAVRRGAVYAVAFEEAEPRVELMRKLRDAYRLPVAVACLDVTAGCLPELNIHELPLRYDVLLLLNVLHHFDEPGPALQALLAVCDLCIIETPFGIGAEPYRPCLPPIEHSMALPPLWVERQARAAGFRLAAIENSPQYEGQRLIYRLEREA